MTALSDALAAAQSRAVAALGKQYVGGQLDADGLTIALDSIGLRDPSDTQEWIAALDVIRETGASLPSVSGNGVAKQDDAATKAQWELIGRICSEKHLTPPEPPLTKAQASAAIEELRAVRS